MNKIVALLDKAAGVVVNYAAHVAVTLIAAFALHFGWHIHVPVFPVSLTSFFGLFAIRTIFQNVATSWHTGRLQAELEHQAKADIMGIVHSLVDAAEGKDNAAKPADPRSGSAKPLDLSTGGMIKDSAGVRTVGER